MTREQYVLQVLEVVCVELSSQGVDLFEATAEQAWNAFLCYMAQHPFSSAVQHHVAFGPFLHAHFSELWTAVQYEACRAMGWLDEERR